MKHNKIAGQRGATLIEVMVSVALLGIIIAVFVQILSDSILLRSKSDLQAQANAIAMDRIEWLKTQSAPPADLSESYTDDSGFLITTTLTEITDSLSLSAQSLPMADADSYGAAEIECNIGNEVAVLKSHALSETVSLSGLNGSEIKLVIRKVAPDSDQRRYELYFDNAMGSQRIDLGFFEKTGAQERLLRFNVLPELSDPLKLTVDDESAEQLHFVVVDDLNARLRLVPEGSETELKITTGLTSDPADDQMNQKYYAVYVAVSKADTVYAKLYSTWAVTNE